MKRMLVHAIAADEVMGRLGVQSKLNADRAFLRYMRDAGRRTADEWLERSFEDLGHRSTIDIQAQYL
jgi:NTE family protein